jgi:hypothetical protein
MARPLRVECPGAVYNITSRGNARQHIFDDDPVNGIYTSRHYRRFVRDGIGQPSIWEGLKGQALLGILLKKSFPKNDERIIRSQMPYNQFFGLG